MSGIKTNAIESTGSDIRVQAPNVLYAPGHIVQVQWNRSMERFYYAVPNNDAGMRNSSFAEGSNQGGTIIRPLDITIAPKSVNSFIHVEFNMFYEASSNIVFSVLREGTLIGAQYYGGDYSQARWVGAGVSRYDNNDNSTPSYIQLNWIDRPGTTGPVTYSIAAKSSDASNRSLTLNSVLGSYQNGQDAHEQGVSFSIAQEIAYEV